MVRSIILCLVMLIMISYNKEKDMEKKKREKFLKIMSKSLPKKSEHEKWAVDWLIKKWKMIPYKEYFKIRGIQKEEDEEVKEEIKKEYKNYEIIYSGRFNSRDIVLIGKRYKYKSCLKWGALYDVTDKKIVKVGEFNNKGLFFYAGNEKDIFKGKDKYLFAKLFYVTMFKTNMNLKNVLAIDNTNIKEFIKYNPEFKEDLSIKMDILITDTYSESFVYGMGYVWWYNKKVKKWKWLIVDTWY